MIHIIMYIMICIILYARISIPFILDHFVRYLANGNPPAVAVDPEGREPPQEVLDVPLPASHQPRSAYFADRPEDSTDPLSRLWEIAVASRCVQRNFTDYTGDSADFFAYSTDESRSYTNTFKTLP